jgi:tRNA pseudouridine38-40 synthase
MRRYFIEVAYVGTRYSGFQVQLNANTIQAEVSRALRIFFNEEPELTGSSRTDAGVHALQNFFHFDTNSEIDKNIIYNLNALLPYDIVVKNIFETQTDAHCRFDAIARTYHYHITRFKNPFAFQRAYYYPYQISTDVLHEMAALLPMFHDFTSFSKKHTQVKNFYCEINSCKWVLSETSWTFEIKADRFLRGMVKGLVATMLRFAKNDQNGAELRKLIESQSRAAAYFSVPSEGLFLAAVDFKQGIFL